MLTPSRKLRVAVLCSRRAPGLETLLARGEEPDAGYRVVSLLSTDPRCGEARRAAERGVTFRVRDIHAFYEERGAPVRDLAVRRDYDRMVLEALAGDRPDVVLLCGYLYLVTRVLLDAFPGRVLNIHHADLELRHPDGGPLYPGLRAVRDAVLAGEPETRSTVHRATDRVDDGPIVVRSEPFPVATAAREASRSGRTDELKAYADTHREWMMEASWGPLLDRALEKVAAELRATTTGDGDLGLSGRTKRGGSAFVLAPAARAASRPALAPNPGAGGARRVSA